MLQLILCILIVYGFVLIIVRGSIFNGPRTWFFGFVSRCEDWFKPTKEICIELLQNNSTEIKPVYFDLHNKLIKTLESDTTNNTIIMAMFADLYEKIKIHVTETRNKRIDKKISLWILMKVQQLIQCPMCIGFWSGISLCVLSSCIPLTIFGTILVLVSGPSIWLSTILMGFLFSGTTWGIDQVVEYFSELKDR